MGWLAAPQALDVGGNGIVVLGGAIIVIVLLCAGVGVNAWIRVRRIDRAAAAEAENGTEPVATPADAAPPIADDFPEDPDYQGPGDWEGGPLDPPEFRTPSV